MAAVLAPHGPDLYLGKRPFALLRVLQRAKRIRGGGSHVRFTHPDGDYFSLIISLSLFVIILIIP